MNVLKKKLLPVLTPLEIGINQFIEEVKLT
jgi:hypothetical protein